MNELPPFNSRHEIEPVQPELDKEAILNKLFEIKEEYGIDVEE